MQSKLSILKNIIWALCIVVCLVALLVGFIAASIPKYDGEQQDGILYLSDRPDGSVPATDAVRSDSESADDAVAETPAAAASLNQLGETADGGQEYIDSLTFLCDTSLMGLKSYALLSGGQATTQFWATQAGNMPASTIGNISIVNPADGVVTPIATAAGANKPKILVISVGMDGLTETTEEKFIADYTSLINSIKSASPETAIVCCSPTSVISSYAGIDGTTIAHCNALKSWIETVCSNTGVYYADIARAVCDPSGTLLDEFASSNGKTITSAGLSKILEYLRTHTIP